MIKKCGGFTLVELLIVISVIGIVAGAVLIAINPLTQMQKGRNAQRKADLRTMSNAIERYKAAYGSYPTTSGNWCGASGSDWNCGGNFIPNIISTGDLKILPIDPITGKPNNITAYCNQSGSRTSYLYRSDGIDYKLLAHCTPEGNVFSSSDPFFDPARSGHAWQISSSDFVKNNW